MMCRKAESVLLWLLFLVHVLGTSTGIAMHLNSSSDEAALLVFKAQITSDAHNIMANWSKGTSFCSWIGVTCSRSHERVSTLQLMNRGLGGVIPKELGQLSFLTLLNLSNNNFHGEIPMELGHLRRLRGLSMEFNNLTGPIPLTIFNMSSLLKLSLAHNLLKGSLPVDVCANLGRLTFLHLGHNQLSGVLPPSLAQCSQLTKLYLGDNQFHGIIPAEFGNFSKLQELALFINNLTGDLPLTIFNISSLRGIDLRKNEISGSFPREPCKRLPNLRFVALGYNRIQGKIHPSISHCNALEALDSSYNEFSGTLPSEIGNLSALEELYLEGVNLEGNIPPSLANISSLNTLTLAENFLYGNIPLEFGQLTNLQKLSLAQNNLIGEIPSSIFNNSGLQILYLDINKLSGSPFVGIARLPLNLVELLLHHNRFTGRIPNSFSNASKLQVLDLGFNFFTGPIPTTLGNLEQLQFINLYDNQLTNDPIMTELEVLNSLTNILYLEYVNFGANPLNTNLPKSFANGSSSVRKIVLPNCSIKGKIPVQISNWRNLIVLVLSDNELIGSIPETLGRLEKLQGLSLEFNKLHGPIPTSLCELRELSSLQLQGNKLLGSLPFCLGKMLALRGLDLSSNAFTSSIPPNIWRNQDILDINLSNNFLTGYLSPEIGNLKHVIALDLSANQLQGQIPSSIGQLQNLINLTLARNKLQGPIPQSFANLVNVQYLDLSENELSGMVPKSLENLRYLTCFNVSFNELAGEVPTGGPFANFTFESFMGNNALCGAPGFHIKGCESKNPRLSHKVKILVYVLPVVASVITLSIFLTLYLKNKNRSSLQNRSQETNPFDHTWRRISYYEILRATQDFDESNLIGRGRFGTVYKGTFPDGLVAAIKVFNLDLQDAFKSFSAECQILSTICHRNLVKVITSCSNLDFKALVLEFMANGDLEKWLYSHNHFLDRVQRLGIMIDVASALEYLHQGYSFPVVHCDLKPNNILLDEDMVAHVGDFGISKLLSEEKLVQTNTIGTIGYVAPEYGSEGIVSTMGDTYSFGILLIETFTRKKPTDDMFSGGLTLKSWVLESFPHAVMEIVDDNLVRRDESECEANVRCFRSIFELALDCSNDLPEERITMKDVALRLKKIKMSLQSNF